MQRFKTKLLNATDRGRISEVLFVFVATTTVLLVFLISVLIVSLFAGIRFLFLYLSVFFSSKLDKLSRTTAKAESRRRTSEEVSATISPRVPRQE